MSSSADRSERPAANGAWSGDGATCTKKTDPPMFDIWDRLNAAVAGGETAKVQAINRALEHERQAGRTRRRSSRSNWTPARQVLSEIGGLIQARHSGPCDTEDGDSYLRAALPWLVAQAGGFAAPDLEIVIENWARSAAPRLDRTAVSACIDEARARNGRGKLYWSAAALGDLVQLTVYEREQLGLTRIRPHDMKEAEFKAYQRARKTAAEKARRRAKGTKPRERSAEQVEPWTLLGVSRRTYYRHLKTGALVKAGTLAAPPPSGTGSCPADTKYLQPATRRCHEPVQGVQGPASGGGPSRSRSAGGPSPGGRTKAVALGHAREPPLPVEDVCEQLDMIGGFQPLGAVLAAYAGGMMPPDLARSVREVLRARRLTQDALAHRIGLSRPQLTNALAGRSGLGRCAAAGLMDWLAAR